jgi:hypothetical protein
LLPQLSFNGAGFGDGTHRIAFRVKQGNRALETLPMQPGGLGVSAWNFLLARRSASNE